MLVKSHNAVELYCYSLPFAYILRCCGQAEHETKLHNILELVGKPYGAWITAEISLRK